jgi:hypothetical protein
MKQIVFRFCEGVLNYSQSRNPLLRARTDAQTNPNAQRATQLRSVLARVFTLSQDRTKLLLLSHNFSNDMINSTSLNEVH